LQKSLPYAYLIFSLTLGKMRRIFETVPAEVILIRGSEAGNTSIGVPLSSRAPQGGQSWIRRIWSTTSRLSSWCSLPWRSHISRSWQLPDKEALREQRLGFPGGRGAAHQHGESSLLGMGGRVAAFLFVCAGAIAAITGAGHCDAARSDGGRCQPSADTPAPWMRSKHSLPTATLCVDAIAARWDSKRPVFDACRRECRCFPLRPPRLP